MLTSQNLKTITDMRQNADGLMKLAKDVGEPIGILKNNKLQAYLIDADSFERIIQFLEEYEDEKIAKQRSNPDDFEDFPEFWE